MSEPLVSVLITSYNSLPFIRKVLDCLLNQTYSNLEIIIVDDGSTDGTIEIIYEKAREDSRIKAFSPGRLGRGKALNYGLSKCSGKYIAINDADDISMSDRIEKQVIFLENYLEFGLVGSHSYLLDYETNTEIIHKRPLTNIEIRKGLTRGQPIQHVTVMIRKSIIDIAGGYNETIKFLFDRDLFIRIGSISKMANLPDVLVEVGHHSGRYFYHQFKGFERELLSLKYRIRAILLFNFPLYFIPREILFSIFSILPLNVRLLIIKIAKKLSGKN